MTLKIYTSTRADGSMKSIHDSDIASTNMSRSRFLEENNINPVETTLVRLTYGQGDYLRYFEVNSSHKGDGITRKSTLVSDALVATKSNHALFLPIGDCIGAIIHDPDQNILMVSHLGRHNLEQYGGVESIKYLVEHHNVDPSRLKIWLSPAAGKDTYPVFAFDNHSLHDVAIRQLCDAGVSSENIEASSVDSAKDAAYYSHSQFLKGNQADDGRFAVVAILREQLEIE